MSIDSRSGLGSINPREEAEVASNIEDTSARLEPSETFLNGRTVSELEEPAISGAIHPSAADSNRSGWLHLQRFRDLGTLEDLNIAMECFAHAVSSTPGSDTNLSKWHADLGVAFTDRFQRFGEPEDLEESIEHTTRALALTPDGDPEMPRWHGSLGLSYGHRYQHLGELKDLEKAIGCMTCALALTPDGHPDLADRYADLGSSYGYRYQRLGELKDLQKSIECDSRALSLTPSDHPRMPYRHASLGVSYIDRYQRLGELADLEEAIEYHSHALSLTPEGHPSMSRRHASLGVCYGDRYQRLGKLSDLEKAIECDVAALALTPEEHPDMPRRHASLGLSYSDRYQRLGELADLEKAIQCHTHALMLTPDNHPSLSHRHADLGMSYGDRYRRLEKLEDLEKAIECHTSALALTHADHPDIASRHGDLGTSYADRYQRLGELADLDRAVENHSRALALTPDGHPDMPRRYASLGASYSQRYQRLGELAELEKAIEYHSSALALTPEDHPDMSHRHAGLGASYTHRYQRLGEVADLEKAIEYNSRALASAPGGHPEISRRHASLGVSYGHRYTHSGEPADIEKAIECHSLALALTPAEHPELPGRYFNHALHFFHQYQHTAQVAHLDNALGAFRGATQLSIGIPRLKFRYALDWANLASEHIALNPIEAYRTAVELLPQFIWLGATTNQRYLDLSANQNLAAKSCYAAIQSSDYSLALEWLEHARCVVWSQTLMLRSPLDLLHASHPEHATRLQTVADELNTYSVEAVTTEPAPHNPITPEQAGQQRRRLAGEYHALLTQTRQLPGFESFLEPMKAEALVRVARNGPVVVVNCHTERCDALIILPGHEDVKHVSLPNFNEDKARRARSELELSLRHKGLRQRGVKTRRQLDHKDDIESMLRVLWDDIVKPVLDYLGYKAEVSQERLPHITWCLIGPLSFLPLHAAGDYSQPRSKIFDYVVSSYIPTLSVLCTSTPCPSNHGCRVLMVGQAATPGHNPLPGTATELAHIKDHIHGEVKYSRLIDDQATVTTVLDAMEHHDWVHLACHAHQNVYDPTKSGFYLHDGTLDLASINRRSFKNKGLAFLSACQTATGDEVLPDEAIHLASGMLMAGYPSVIATMWSVSDEDAPFIADSIYGQLMKDRKIGNGEAGRALHNAVAGLREKVGEKEFGRWVPYIHLGS